ncbi:MAG: hypothetical protein K9H64_00070 [Bacteroidales bacterium]|nr:hypothetical protein [Bacteroidales bacterium]MCF8454289.1 hypothetical protein [Bacteroidales bacterium]
MTYREQVITEVKSQTIFFKPESICKELNEWEKSILLLDESDFAKVYKEKIRSEINSFGLQLRMAVLTDIDAVHDFIVTCFLRDPEAVSKYDIFRFIENGHGLIIENEHRQILGCLFEVGYEKDQKKISYSIRLGIDGSIKGKGLGKLLTIYSCLLAMEKGSQVKIGLIHANNFPSLHIHVNQAGWLIDTFYHNLGTLGLCFEFSLPLTPEALLVNRIDLDKVQTYIGEYIEGIDYLLIKSEDIEAIKTLTKNGAFKIAAVITLKQIHENPLLFALPVEMLYDRYKY